MINFALTDFKKDFSFINFLLLFLLSLRLLFKRRLQRKTAALFPGGVILFDFLLLKVINPDSFVEVKPSRGVPFEFYFRVSPHFLDTEKTLVASRTLRFKPHSPIHSILLHKLNYSRYLISFQKLQTTLY